MCRITTVLYCSTMLLRERERVQKFKTQVPQVAISRSSRNIWIQDLTSEIELGRENVEDEWIFAAGLQHNQIKSGPSFKAPIGRNQTCEA